MIPSFYKSESRDFTLLQGDCIELLSSFEFKFDMIFADPPYFLSNGGISCQAGKVVCVDKGDWDKSPGEQSVNDFNLKWLSACRDKLKDNGKYGKWLYIRSTLSTFATYSSKHFRIYADGRLFYDGPVFSGAVGIGKYNGGGMKQTPQAKVDDGLMDLTIIRKMSKLKIIRNFRLLYSGSIYDVPNVLFTQAKRIDIETNPSTRIEIDGEAVGESPFTFELVPGSIRVVIGPHYKIEN